jgi:hypothetical protein
MYLNLQNPDWRFTAEMLANGASILTAIIAAFFFVQFHLGRRWKRQRLEAYLKKRREDELEANKTRPPTQKKEGKHSLLHLLENVGMTEAELVDASFRSKTIVRTTGRDENGMAAVLMLMYDPSKGRRG